jgi:hypothetical protein
MDLTFYQSQQQLIHISLVDIECNAKILKLSQKILSIILNKI